MLAIVAANRNITGNNCTPTPESKWEESERVSMYIVASWATKDMKEKEKIQRRRSNTKNDDGTEREREMETAKIGRCTKLGREIVGKRDSTAEKIDTR